MENLDEKIKLEKDNISKILSACVFRGSFSNNHIAEYYHCKMLIERYKSGNGQTQKYDIYSNLYCEYLQKVKFKEEAAWKFPELMEIKH